MSRAWKYTVTATISAGDGTITRTENTDSWLVAQWHRLAFLAFTGPPVTVRIHTRGAK